MNTPEAVKYDDLVVGSGISGMAMALLLAQAGRKVLLIEKQSSIGGCMRRFKRKGIPFDTGFHFTGGFDGLLSDMLRALGMEQDVIPEFLDAPQTNRIYLENSNSMYEMPSGIDAIGKELKKQFPDECEAIDKYLQLEDDIEQRTPFMNLNKLNTEELFVLMQQLDEDFISLQQYLESITSNTKLQTVLAAAALCYGSPPKVTPLSAHCRASVGMHKSLARVIGGGEAFIKSFKRRAQELNIDLMTGTEISEIVDRHGKMITAVKLSNGAICHFKNCILSIHPREIISILPEDAVPAATSQAIEQAEESFSFFSLFATIQTDYPVSPALTSYISHDNLNAVISPNSDACAMAILTGTEIIDNKPVNILCAFENEFPADANRWQKTADRKNNAAYQQYKARRAEAMIKKIENVYPEYAGKINILCAASTLTFEDYIPPLGSAYGAMHKVGEQSLFGRLPVRNFYAIGQSALLPGVVGAMLSSFIVGRYILGRDFI
ncbi:MAG: NAD(P)-binding protein [Victivallaceae bacterium]